MVYGHTLLAKGHLGIMTQIIVDCYLTAHHLNSDEISWNLMRPMSRVAWSMGVRMEIPSQSHDMTVQMRYTQENTASQHARQPAKQMFGVGVDGMRIVDQKKKGGGESYSCQWLEN